MEIYSGKITLVGMDLCKDNWELKKIEIHHETAVLRTRYTVVEYFRKIFYVEYLLSFREKHSYVRNKTTLSCPLKPVDVALY